MGVRVRQWVGVFDIFVECIICYRRLKEKELVFKLLE